MSGVFLYLYHCGVLGACLQRARRKGARLRGRPLPGTLQLRDNCGDTCGVLVRIISVLRDLEGVWPASD
jgi:hypothetical protein